MPTRTPAQDLVLSTGVLALIAATAALAHLGLAIVLGAIATACITSAGHPARARRAAFAIAGVITVHVLAMTGAHRAPSFAMMAETVIVLYVLRSIFRSQRAGVAPSRNS